MTKSKADFLPLFWRRKTRPKNEKKTQKNNHSRARTYFISTKCTWFLCEIWKYKMDCFNNRSDPMYRKY